MPSKNIKNRIISDLKAINPKRIILFGSFGTDKFRKRNSDIDLLIIKDTEKKPADRYSEARLCLSVPYPFDIFVLTSNELKKKLKESFFFREIIEKGEMIYEQN